jgi:hypothetical protein
LTEACITSVKGKGYRPMPARDASTPRNSELAAVDVLQFGDVALATSPKTTRLYIHSV